MKKLILDLRGGKEISSEQIKELCILCSDGKHEWISLIDSCDQMYEIMSQILHNPKMSYGFCWGETTIKRELETANEFITIY